MAFIKSCRLRPSPVGLKRWRARWWRANWLPVPRSGAFGDLRCLPEHEHFFLFLPTVRTSCLDFISAIFRAATKCATSESSGKERQRDWSNTREHYILKLTPHRGREHTTPLPSPLPPLSSKRKMTKNDFFFFCTRE